MPTIIAGGQYLKLPDIFVPLKPHKKFIHSGLKSEHFWSLDENIFQFVCFSYQKINILKPFSQLLAIFVANDHHETLKKEQGSGWAAAWKTNEQRTTTRKKVQDVLASQCLLFVALRLEFSIHRDGFIVAQLLLKKNFWFLCGSSIK